MSSNFSTHQGQLSTSPAQRLTGNNCRLKCPSGDTLIVHDGRIRSSSDTWRSIRQQQAWMHLLEKYVEEEYLRRLEVIESLHSIEEHLRGLYDDLLHTLFVCWAKFYELRQWLLSSGFPPDASIGASDIANGNGQKECWDSRCSAGCFLDSSGKR